MAKTCDVCGNEVGFFGGLIGRKLCGSCDSERKAQEREAREQARERFEIDLATLRDCTLSSPGAGEQLKAKASAAGMSDKDFRDRCLMELERYLEVILEDDLMTVVEGERFDAYSDALGISNEVFQDEFQDFIPRLYVAKANDGRLPTMRQEQLMGTLMLKEGEVAHMEANASLMKLITKREWQGGYRGFSFKLVKGVRFHTGSVRGRSVDAGTELKEEDVGFLTVTSERLIFRGDRKTVEIQFSKLLSLNVFEDGIQFHISNRQTAPLFRLEPGIPGCVAATISATAEAASD